MQRPPEKRLRHYAAEIITLRSLAARRAAIDAAPEHLRALVRAHVADHFAKRALLREAVA
jgi:hypothetical protein